MEDHSRLCPICSGNMQIFKEVDIDLRWKIQYHYCQNCGLIHSFDHPFFDTVLYEDHFFENVDRGWRERDDEIFALFDRHFRKVKSLRVLDIGSGKNYFVSRLVQAGYNAYGVDPYSEPVYAKDHFFGDLNSLPYSSFDVIVLLEVVEHFISPIEEFERLMKYLNPNGKIFISTVIRRDRSQSSTDWYINPCYGHVTIWSMKALFNIFSKFGFKSVTIYRAGNLQIWDKTPGSFFKLWPIQCNISSIRSALGRIRYRLKERFHDLFRWRDFPNISA
jgi:cyclopropane fatty-acyl-phospholipid synthase-like methyltransferase